jgi:hypothetical protein
MKPLNCLTSACRYCQYYQPEGRRGGVCRQLGVPVEGRWKACTLAIPAFAPSWEGLEEMIIVPNETPVRSDTRPLGCTLNNSALAVAESIASSTPERKLAALWY